MSILEGDLTQVGGIGPVQAEFLVCAHQDGSTCPRPVSSDVAVTGEPAQMLVALLVPSDYPVPNTFTFIGETAPVFRPSPTYTAELQRLSPAARGTRWAGYISDVASFPPGGRAQLVFTFDRPAPADGSPRPKDAEMRLVVGARSTTGGGGRPVYCGATSADLEGYADETTCLDGSYNIRRSSMRDLALSGGAPVTVPAGATAIVPVTARYVGDGAAEINFSLTAATTVPGTTAVPNAVSYAPPANSTNTVQVSVPIPAGTAPGTYGVTLIAALPSGQTRTGSGTIVVQGPGGPAPAGSGPAAVPAPAGAGTGAPNPATGVPAATVCDGRAATIVGTAAADRLRGTPGRDVIAGLGGADRIDGRGGDDVICGGAGPDILGGGAGNDRLLGGAGADRLAGGAGRDVLVGGPGLDRLLGGPGLDSLRGGAGPNVLIQ